MPAIGGMTTPVRVRNDTNLLMMPAAERTEPAAPTTMVTAVREGRLPGYDDAGVIAASSEQRDGLRHRYAEWLSVQPSGL